MLLYGLRTDGYARKREQKCKDIATDMIEMCELTPQEILAYIEDMAQGK